MAKSRYSVICPSCDADVPVAATASVGKKIECPKCKYRFPCPPPPGGDAEADEPKGKGKGKKADKKKGGSTVLIGAGLGVLAVAVLVGGAIFVLGDSEEPPKSNPNGGGTVTPVPPPQGLTPPPPTVTTPPPTTTGSGNHGPKSGPSDPDVTPPPAGRPSAEVQRPPRSTPLPEVTNLIPGDAVGVYHVNTAQAVKTPLYRAFFDPTIRDLFQDSFFFRSELISGYVHAVVGPDRDPFVVLRTESPVDDKVMLAQWGSEAVGIPKDSPVRNRYFYLLKSNPFLKAVGGAFAPDSVAGQLGVRLANGPKKAADRPWAFHAYDDQTLILTTEPSMVRFLGDLQTNGYPPFKTHVEEKAAMPDAPAGGAPGAATPEGPRPAGGPTPAGGAPVSGAPAAPPKRLFTTIRNYQTIEPDLKRTLNTFETNPAGDPPVAIYAETLDQRMLASRGVGRAVGRELPPAQGLVEAVRVLGFALTGFNNERLTGSVSLEFVSDDAAKVAAHQQVLPSLLPATFALGPVLGYRVYLVNEVGPPPAQTADGALPPGGQPPAASGTPGNGFPLGVLPLGGQLPTIPEPVGAFPFFPLGSSPNSPSGTVPYPQPGPGGFPPPTGSPDVPPGPGGPGTNPDGTPGGPPVPAGPRVSAVTVSANDRVLNIDTAILWGEDKFAAKVMPVVNRTAAQFRGKMVVLSGKTDADTLAAVGPKLVARKAPFPRGALDRVAQQDRFRLSYPPEQRTSFLADLLPYIGRGGLRTQLQDRKFAWYAPENLPSAEAWVPEFLVPSYPAVVVAGDEPARAGRPAARRDELRRPRRRRPRRRPVRPEEPGTGEVSRHHRVRLGFDRGRHQGRVVEHGVSDPGPARPAAAVDRWRRFNAGRRRRLRRCR